MKNNLSKNTIPKREKAASVIRKATVPPVMILYLIIVLAVSGKNVFRNPFEALLALFLLGIIPVLAYPLQKVLPGFKDKGRDGQRKLAFILTFFGYTANYIAARVLQMEQNYMLVASTYFLSIVFLSVFNIFTPLKASGHACSFTGPAVLLAYIVHPSFIIIGVILGVVVCCASIILKRHTAAQLACGIIVCVCAFFISIWLC